MYVDSRNRKQDYSRKSKYKYVVPYIMRNNIPVWRAIIPYTLKEFPYTWRAIFKTEREAAIAVDKKMISVGRNPVNILKPKLTQ